MDAAGSHDQSGLRSLQHLTYCGSLKFNVTVVCISTGRPFTVCGLNRHCFTAVVEAAINCSGPLTTCTSCTPPFRTHMNFEHDVPLNSLLASVFWIYGLDPAQQASFRRRGREFDDTLSIRLGLQRSRALHARIVGNIRLPSQPAVAETLPCHCHRPAIRPEEQRMRSLL